MRVYKNDMYDGRGLTWQPWANDPQCQGPEDAWPWPPLPYPPFCGCPPEPPRCRFPFPQPVPFPYPFPCPKQEPCPKPGPKPCPRDEEAFGYFSSITAGGAFSGGDVPFTFSSDLNRNVSLVSSSSTQVKIRETGIYRAVYSVTATGAVSGVFLQLKVSDSAVSNTQIPIQEGVNVNEALIFLKRGDTVSINLTGAVNLASGKNASLLLQLISRR